MSDDDKLVRMETAIERLTEKLDTVASGQLEMIVEFKHYRKEVDTVKESHMQFDERLRSVENKLPIYDDMKADRTMQKRSIFGLGIGFVTLMITTILSLVAGKT